MSGNPARAVSLFTDFLENELGLIDVTDIEPEEITALCNDPVFRKVADYCRQTRGGHKRDRDSDDGSFDLDELGVDPREEYDAATDL